MKRYPIRCKRDTYRGSNSSKSRKAAAFNSMAVEIESYINSLLLKQTMPIQEYSYHELASATGYSEMEILDVCFQIDCGHNGFTIIRHDIKTLEEALALSGIR